MSRIGRKPISIPTGVTVEVNGRSINVTGPKGNLSMELMPGLELTQNDNILTLTKDEANPQTLSSFGLTRTLIDNMVQGVSAGFQRQLEINGVGYRASLAGNQLTLSLGFSHPVLFPLPAGIEAKVERNVITISGHDKQLVGQVAANIRALKKPEPYKGKGIKYVEERVRRKPGKAASRG